MEGEAKVISSEYKVNVEASKVWKLYSTLELANLIQQKLPLIHKVDVLHGDGGVGSILQVTFAPGSGMNPYKEKFTKIDNENRIKEVEAIEGGYLDVGLSKYLIRLEIIDKGPNKCVIRSSIEYKIKEEAKATFSPNVVSIKSLEDIAKIVSMHLQQP